MISECDEAQQWRLTEWAEELAAVGAVERGLDSLGGLDGLLGLGHDGGALGGGGGEHLLLHHGGHFRGEVVTLGMEEE